MKITLRQLRTLIREAVNEASLTPDQIREFSVDQVMELTADQINSMTKDQLEALGVARTRFTPKELFQNRLPDGLEWQIEQEITRGFKQEQMRVLTQNWPRVWLVQIGGSDLDAKPSLEVRDMIRKKYGFKVVLTGQDTATPAYVVKTPKPMTQAQAQDLANNLAADGLDAEAFEHAQPPS
jgi:hypothetical protein